MPTDIPPLAGSPPADVPKVATKSGPSVATIIAIIAGVLAIIGVSAGIAFMMKSSSQSTDTTPDTNYVIEAPAEQDATPTSPLDAPAVEDVSQIDSELERLDGAVDDGNQEAYDEQLLPEIE
jgi:flagellar basal body-associated protein FliL